jgi:hypothetical protein
MAVAISSRRWRAFIQNSRLIYQCGMCSEEAEQQEEDVADVQGILLTEVFLLNEAFIEVLGGSVVNSLHESF